MRAQVAQLKLCSRSATRLKRFEPSTAASDPDNLFDACGGPRSSLWVIFHRSARQPITVDVYQLANVATGWAVRQGNEILKLRDCVHFYVPSHQVFIFGSNQSRRESPNRLNPNTASEMAMPGKIATQGALSA